MGEITRAVLTASSVFHNSAIYGVQIPFTAAMTSTGPVYFEAKADRYFLCMSIMAFLKSTGFNAMRQEMRLDITDVKTGRKWTSKPVYANELGGNLASNFEFPEYILIEPNDQLKYEVTLNPPTGTNGIIFIDLAGIEYGMPDGN
jgi:hypothetical protein